MVPHWIHFRIDDLDEKTFRFLRGFSGSAKQRRKSLRAAVRQLRQGRNLKVSKHIWKKGESSLTSTTVWTKTYKSF